MCFNLCKVQTQMCLQGTACSRHKFVFTPCRICAETTLKCTYGFKTLNVYSHVDFLHVAFDKQTQKANASFMSVPQICFKRFKQQSNPRTTRYVSTAVVCFINKQSICYTQRCPNATACFCLQNTVWPQRTHYHMEARRRKTDEMLLLWNRNVLTIFVHITFLGQGSTRKATKIAKFRVCVLASWYTRNRPP